jgi:glycosyltransferase involved in cell wall biosynthesis
METNISVAISTYNGEKYIEKQLLSILNQSMAVDEILIIDDNSNDKTKEVIKLLIEKHPKILLIENLVNIGPVASFQLAIKSCKYDFILLSDQDDIWTYNKVEICLHQMLLLQVANIPALIFSDLELIDEFDNYLSNSFWKLHNFSKKDIIFNKALFVNVATGCTMMINKHMKEEVKLMPKDVMMHDHWIYLIALGFGNLSFIDKPLVKYRSHSNTVTLKHKISNIRSLFNYFNKNCRKEYLINNISQALLFYNIYRNKLNKKNLSEIKKFTNLNNKSFFYKKIYILLNNLN